MELSHQAGEGGFVRFTDRQGASDDANHITGVGIVHLALFGYIGRYEQSATRLYLGGGTPDFRGAQISMRIRGNNWIDNGAYLATWIQANNDTTKAAHASINRANWVYNSVPLDAYVASGQWETATWTLANRTSSWLYAGRNDTSPPEAQRYFYGELDRILSNIDLNIFPVMVVGVNQSAEPSGTIDYDELDITYRDHSVTSPSNGGTLVSYPAGGSDPSVLTDGWRHGSGHVWQSASSPTGPLEFVYSFAHAITMHSVYVHNDPDFPSKDIEIAVSENGSSWTTVSTAVLPSTSASGPNLLFHFKNAVSVSDFVPLHATPVTHLRVRVTSGYQSTKWGLGAIEAYGTGAQEETDDDWYDVNQDVAIAPGTYHYRIVTTNDRGVSYGPDQTVTVQ